MEGPIMASGLPSPYTALTRHPIMPRTIQDEAARCDFLPDFNRFLSGGPVAQSLGRYIQRGTGAKATSLSGKFVCSGASFRYAAVIVSVVFALHPRVSMPVTGWRHCAQAGGAA